MAARKLRCSAVMKTGASAVSLLFFFSITLTASSGCSTIQSLNPFSSEDPSISGDGVGTGDAGGIDTGGKAANDSAPVDAPQNRTDGSEAAAIAKSGTAQKNSVVEVIWQVPTEAVETYHLYYGLTEDDLSNHIAVPVGELERASHPRFGPVYRYRLKDIPSSQTVYISLAAENRAGMSPKTPVAKIAPGQQTVTP